MKATHSEVLKRQIEIGQDLIKRLHDTVDEHTLDTIQHDYEHWDKLNNEVLQKSSMSLRNGGCLMIFHYSY